MLNPEVIRIHEVDGKQFATIAYTDFKEGLPINNHNMWIDVPVNLRPMQKSVRGNYLVDQSVRGENAVAANVPVDLAR